MKYLYCWSRDESSNAPRGSRDWLSSPIAGKDQFEAKDDEEAIAKVQNMIRGGSITSVDWMYAIDHEVKVP